MNIEKNILISLTVSSDSLLLFLFSNLKCTGIQSIHPSISSENKICDFVVNTSGQPFDHLFVTDDFEFDHLNIEKDIR